jgi:hypothetical protein
MSTGLECNFIEIKPNQWYYLLENWGSPKGGWDWREYATAYGPFTDEGSADQHLRDHHANPGGSSTSAYDENYTPDKVMQRLIAEAIDPQAIERDHFRLGH